MLSVPLLTLRALYFELSELHFLEHFQDFTGVVTAWIECSAFPIKESKGPAHSDADGKFPITSVQADLGQHFWKEMLVHEGFFILTSQKSIH